MRVQNTGVLAPYWKISFYDKFVQENHSKFDSVLDKVFNTWLQKRSLSGHFNNKNFKK